MNSSEEEQFVKKMIKKLPQEIIHKIIGYMEVAQEDLYTCEHCGRVWDGNAQCFPCIYD